MFNFNEVKLEHLAIHKVGNKVREDESLLLSSDEIKISDEFVKEILMRYFLTGFKSDEFYFFEDQEGQLPNDFKSLVKDVFDNPSSTFDFSLELANRLYESSVHPNIKGGEFYCTYLTKCKFGEEYVDAIGLFKSETKDYFIKIFPDQNEFDIQAMEGINIKKLDKGCIIFNVHSDEGYKVVVLDKTNFGSEVAMYWKKDFLKLSQVQDSFYHTANYLDLCKNFVSNVFNSDHDVPRQDQVMMLNKSFEYFDTNPEFNQDDFNRKVINDDPGVIEAFETYKHEFQSEKDFAIPEQFSVSETAVKDNKKHFKSILKLDKKFHVYVHGGENFIERGFDDGKRMNFYKLYFHNEL
jgi:hypothetical protein